MALLPTSYRPHFPLPPGTTRRPRARLWLGTGLARQVIAQNLTQTAQADFQVNSPQALAQPGGTSIGHGPGSAEDGTAADLGTELPSSNLTGVQPTPDAHPEDSLHDSRSPLPPAEHPHPDIVQQPADRRGPAQPQDGETPRPQV